MDTHLDHAMARVMSPEQRASDELVRLIVKLRWMGLDEEANCIERRLLSCPADAGQTVLAEPQETD
jgi:hypothetical protein